MTGHAEIREVTLNGARFLLAEDVARWYRQHAVARELFDELEAENGRLRDALRDAALANPWTHASSFAEKACKRFDIPLAASGSAPGPRGGPSSGASGVGDEPETGADIFHPPYRCELPLHGPATIYDAVEVGWIARVKESLPHKAVLARVIVDALNSAAVPERGDA